MSNVPIKDADSNTRKVDTFTRTEGADQVETQAVALVDPSTGQLVLGAPADAAATDDTGSFSLVSLFKRSLVYMAAVSAAIKGVNVAGSGGDKGMLLLARRWDADTATTTADGQYTPLKQDEAGRLKVATQPASMASTTGIISASGASLAFDTNRAGTLVITMSSAAVAGHSAVFEFSNNSTDGQNGDWKTVQAVRSDSNIIETGTGVLNATPAYGWELNVSAYAWVRVRCTAHASGDATYVFKPGAYATEPVPSSQNPPLQSFTFTQTGVIAINTVLMTIDCANFKYVNAQYTSIGTSGVVTHQWSNDGAQWNAAPLVSITTQAQATTVSATGAYSGLAQGRFFRMLLTTATTAGTTTIAVVASQSPQSPPSQSVNGTVSPGASVNRIGFTAGSGVWYDDSSTVLAAAATFTGSARDCAAATTGTAFNAANAMGKEVRVSAESDQAGTLWLEVSRDATNWRRVKAVPTAAVTGGGQYAEIIHAPSWRYARVGFTNGATLQTRFSIGTFLMAA